MSRKRSSLGKQLVMATAFTLGASGVALADGSSMNPFTGDSYAFFNGGCTIQQQCKAVFDNAPSAFRKANPQGLSESQLQTIADEGPTHVFTPAVVDKTASVWRQEHRHGLSESELQAIASEGPTWQYRIEAENAAQKAAQDAALADMAGAAPKKTAAR